MTRSKPASPPLRPLCTLDLPVVEVTLLEDRAQVRRHGTVQLTPGSHHVQIAGVSPLIADRSLRAKAGQGVRVVELKVQRRWRLGSEEKPEDAAELQRQSEQLEAEIEHADDLLGALEQRRQLLQQSSSLWIDNINRELPFAQSIQEQWASEHGALRDELAAVDRQWIQAQKKKRELERSLDGLALHHDQRDSVDDVLEASLLATIDMQDERACDLDVYYTVPCALWRPIHRAQLAGDRLQFWCDAALWQATGEDWPEATLRFSTARSTLQAEPPLLEDDELRVQRRLEKKIEVSAREVLIASTGEGGGHGFDGLPGVDDGGETRLLQARLRMPIVADGRMHRVPLFEFSDQAQVDRLCCAELDALVHRRARARNSSGQAILAGPVDLLLDGTLLGRSQIGFIAPGENLALGFGSDDSLRVRREVSEKRETSSLSGKQTITRRVELYVSNLDDRAQQFELHERIPVSEIEKVTIILDDKETQPLARPDEHGVLRWPIRIAAHGTEAISLQYRIVADGKVRGL